MLQSTVGMKEKFEGQKREFALSNQDLLTIADGFKKDMEAGLRGDSSSLKMLPSFLQPPSGEECGPFLAVDFGGTNVRALLLQLQGAGHFEIVKKTVFYKIVKKTVFPLIDKAGRYDYTSATTTAEELFGAIAKAIAGLVEKDEEYYLGHTFSFPCKQNAIDSAELLFWTKEIKTVGVEGNDVGKLLNAALQNAGLSNVVNNAIINDTVGTLLASAYATQNVTIGSICGTGHNSCYVEAKHPLTGKPMIVNLESGNFDKLKDTSYDLYLDKASKMPGTQRLEKMSSGYYLGPLSTLVVADLLAGECADKKAEMDLIVQKLNLQGENLSSILSDKSEDLRYLKTLLKERLPASEASLDLEALKIIQQAVHMVVERSARLVSATYAGILRHIDAEMAQKHVIAVDGSLYEKMPYFADVISDTLNQVLLNGEKSDKITVVLSKDGSGIGAAIAAAAAKHMG